MPGKLARVRRTLAPLTRLSAKRVMRLEPLEHRRCLSATPTAFAGDSQLEVDPTSYDDTTLIVKYAEEQFASASVFGPSRIAGSDRIGFGVHKIELQRGVSLDSMLSLYRRNQNVLYAEPDFRVQIAAIPDDPRFSDQWNFHNTGQSGGTVNADIDAPEAWDVPAGPGSTIVAVIDTGVDYLHPDLAPNMWTNPGEIAGDGIDNDGNGYVDDVHGYDFFNEDGSPLDDHNHGTHVAGTIGAEGNDGTGVAGINWNVQIMALKFLGSDGSGSTSDAIAAVQYAVDHGAQISNNSWGGDPYSQALYDVIADAEQVGHIFVTAAGNGNFIGIGQNNDAAPFYPASYDLDNIVAVAATDRNDQRGFFSNYGATSVDIGAPGVDILSTTIGGYGNSSGTSMAAPHVAGALSLVRDFDPSLSYRQIIDRVLLSADPIEALDGITVTGGRLNLASALIPDTLGPHIIGIDPGGLTLDPFSSVRISFNESVDATTFTLADIDPFTGPQGSISATSLSVVPGSNSRQFDLSFPSQSDPGTYELVINPSVTDRFGNLLDQNENGVGGEVAGDQFTHQIDKVDAIARIDFGTTGSPVASGYTRVTGGDQYNAATGYGWQSTNVYSLNRGGEPLTQDFNYTSSSTFAYDVPNGEYDVIVTLGESIVAHDQMGVFLENVQADSVTTAAGQFAVNTYRTSVSDGQLSLGLQDLGGSDPWVMINGVDIVFAGPDASGPSVATTDATGTVSGPIEKIHVSFSEPIQNGSFTLADIGILEGPSGSITPTAVNQLGPGDFEILFDAQNDSGQYRLVIGPDIVDIAGNPMDQDGDGINAEPLDDSFETIFLLEAGLPSVARFDFGTATSALEPDYTRINGGANLYNATVGYGWQTTSVYSLTRGGVPLTQDVNYTTNSTFAVDLPNGEYDLVVTMGEALIPHDQMGVFIEDVPFDSITTAAYEFKTNTYRASISDGQLNLGLRDLGGSNPYAVINGLEILYVGPDASGPSVSSTDASGTLTGPIERLHVSFSEPIEPGSFTLADITLFEGPSGVIAPTAVNQLAPGDFEITFDSQNDTGEYRLEIGPDIVDIAGNLMDQDGDGVAGDSFETTFDVEAGLPIVARFDFGTATSTLETDYIRINGGFFDRYDAEVGYGWETTNVYSVTRTGDALTKDLNYTTNSTFAVDLPNGEYDLIVTMGEAIIPHDQMGVFVEDVQFDTITTAAYEFKANTYRVSISDGQLNLGITDLGGSNPYAVINSLEILYVGPDTNGPSVTSTDASGTLTGPLDRVTVSFSEPIQAGSFTLADVAVLEGPTGPITPTAVNQVSPGDFEITFDAQNDSGLYRIVIGPDIVDVAGNPMDQDGDGAPAEPLDDQFETTFTLEAGLPSVGRFDFGTATSALETDFIRINGGFFDRYSAEVGYGWQSTNVYSLTRGGAPLTQDVNYTTNSTFAVDLPNGQYDLIVTMGEALIPHDQMGVFIEGVQVDSITTAAYEFKVNTYRASVSDGQLNLGLTDLGGTNLYAVINGLEVLYVGGLTQALAVIAPTTSDAALRDIDLLDDEHVLTSETAGVAKAKRAETVPQSWQQNRSNTADHGRVAQNGPGNGPSTESPSPLDSEAVDLFFG